MNLTHKDVGLELEKLGDSTKADFHTRFFKTGKGEYGEGDVFIGITVPKQRIVAKKFVQLPLIEIEKLLQSKIHEHRLTALFILVYKFTKATEQERKDIYDLYLRNTKYINNWDLVDSSASFIVGGYLVDKDRSILYKLAKSKDLWEKRIAVIATYYFIKRNGFAETLQISEILLNDTHDLIHKAVGWMLRELGKMNKKTEEEFLLKYHKTMPRAMLRYAIEKFSSQKRTFYLGI